MNEKKKYFIIIIVSLLALLVLVLVNVFETNKAKRIKTQWNIENQKELATAAIESYALQSVSEPKESRNNRLKKYFSVDSPVLEYKPENLIGGVIKSSAEVQSINQCEEQEGGDLCLLVKTKTKLETLSSSSSKTQTYWLTIIKTSDNKFKAYDSGLWEE